MINGHKYQEAVNIVKEESKVSTFWLSRRMGIGYAQAASYIDRMEVDGIVSLLMPGGMRRVLK